MADANIYTHTNIKIILDTDIDLTGATNPEIHYKKPDGTPGEWTASIVNRSVEYITSTDDLDQDGEWKLQPVVTLGTNLVKGKIVDIRISEPIKTN